MKNCISLRQLDQTIYKGLFAHFSSPDTKGHVRYYHHFVSIIVCIYLIYSETTVTIGTKLGSNIYWMILYEVAFFIGNFAYMEGI